MKILFSVGNLKIGGAQKVVLNVASELSKNHEVYIYDHFPDIRNKDFVKEFLPKNVKVYSISENNFIRKTLWKFNAILQRANINKDFFYSLNKYCFKKNVKKLNIDIINSHMFFSDLIVASIKGVNIPKVISLHGCYEEKMLINQQMYSQQIAQIAKGIDGIVYLTEKNYQPLKLVSSEFNNIPKIKLPNGINIISNGTNIRAKGDELIISMVGRCVKEKGWDIAINSFNKLIRILPGKKLKLWLIGDGPYLEILKEKYLPNINIEFKGWVADPSGFISQSYLGILPSESESESFPMVILEFLKFGIPFIASDAGESKSILCDNIRCGTIISNSNLEKEKVELYTSALFELINDRELYHTFSLNAKEKIKNYTISNVADQYIAFFEERIALPK